MGGKVALDTNIIVILAGGDSPLKDARFRALQTINDHMGKGDSVVLPAAALAECCHTLPKELEPKLQIESLSAAAAVLANRIVGRVRKATQNTNAAEAPRPTREEMKLDALILATAETCGARILYRGPEAWFDTAKANCPELRIEIRQLPELHPEQLEIEDG